MFKGGKAEKVSNIHFESENFTYCKNDHKFRIRAGGRDCPMGTRRASVHFFFIVPHLETSPKCFTIATVVLFSA